MNSKVKILGKQFYSPNLRDVAMLEGVQSQFFTFNTFACSLAGKKYRPIYGNLKMRLNFFLAQLQLSNSVNTIICLVS